MTKEELGQYAEKLDEVAKRLEVCNLVALSKRVGLSRPTLYSVMNGDTGRIRLETFIKLVKYFGLE